MAQPRDLRLVQAARLLGLDAAAVTTESIRAAIAADPAALASALREEAAASDDVTSAATARAYFEARMADLADFIDVAAAPRVRAAFETLTAAWG